MSAFHTTLSTRGNRYRVLAFNFCRFGGDGFGVMLLDELIEDASGVGVLRATLPRSWHYYSTASFGGENLRVAQQHTNITHYQGAYAVETTALARTFLENANHRSFWDFERLMAAPLPSYIAFGEWLEEPAGASVAIRTRYAAEPSK